MTRYEAKKLGVCRIEMNAWRTDYNYWRLKLGEANKGNTWMKKGPIMTCMNQARAELKRSMREVHAILYP